jgi:steroid delta-isomerase-like uncharacterized protein
MSVEANRALVRRYYELLNAGDLEGVAAMTRPDFVCWVGGRPEPITGLETNLAMERQHRAAFSDMHSEVQDLIAEGDRVAVRRTWRLTHTGEFEGLPPSGRTLTGTAMEFIRLDDAGQLAEFWTESDGYSFMAQLGALPAPASEPGL